MLLIFRNFNWIIRKRLTCFIWQRTQIFILRIELLCCHFSWGEEFLIVDPSDQDQIPEFAFPLSLTSALIKILTSVWIYFSSEVITEHHMEHFFFNSLQTEGILFFCIKNTQEILYSKEKSEFLGRYQRIDPYMGHSFKSWTQWSLLMDGDHSNSEYPMILWQSITVISKCTAYFSKLALHMLSRDFLSYYFSDGFITALSAPKSLPNRDSQSLLCF